MMNLTRFLALLFIPAFAYAWPNLPSRIQIAPANEPGERLVIIGHVSDANGKPHRVELYAYHTDARGLYRPDGSFKGEPRLRGTLLTAADGSYEIDTIKPAPYPGRSIPAHIHVHLRWLDRDQEEEIRFEGPGATVCHVAQGRCTVDFRLRAE